MIKALGGFAILLHATTSLAVVNMKNANYSETWTPLQIAGSGFDLRTTITYNSRSLFNGTFGFGWCSDFETKVDILSDGRLKLTECGGGLETTFAPQTFDAKAIDRTNEQIIIALRKKNPSLSKVQVDETRSSLTNDPRFREALAEQVGVRSAVAAGQSYRANGIEDESIKFDGRTYTRNLANGSFQKFNTKGKLVSLYDRNGNFLNIDYAGDRITKVMDNNGRQLLFSYAGERLSKISGPNNLEAAFKFAGENLIELKDQAGQIWKFEYDTLHNMTKSTYPDGTFKALTYNEDRDWVMSFRNRKGCMENYVYDVKKVSGDDVHTSNVEKRCNGKVTNTSLYEFFYKTDPNTKASYLQRVRSRINGLRSEWVYHPVHGKPILSSENGVATEFTYYDDGNIKTRKLPTAEYTYQYDTTCSKIAQVQTKYFGFRTPATPGDAQDKPVRLELLRTIKSEFQYDKRCNLLVAKNSDGQVAKLFYDLKGRIVRIEDQAKKVVNIEYESRFGKPSLVARPGLGAMKVVYRPDGTIDKVESKDGPRIVAQVSNVFNNLLEIIGPATNQLNL